MREDTLFDRLRRVGFYPQHAVEVGVYLPETSNLYQFIAAGVRCTLVEADPDIGAKIKKYFAGKTNVSLYPVAVFDRNGSIELVRRGPSTYAADIERSPAVVNDGYRVRAADRFAVEAVTFDRLDDRTIDLLSIDVEGGEWYVLKHMHSRPTVICLETHGLAYTNPHIADIRAWMHENKYRLWYKNDSDSVYVKEGTFAITASEKLRLLATNARLYLKKLKKQASRRLRFGGTS